MSQDTPQEAPIPARRPVLLAADVGGTSARAVVGPPGALPSEPVRGPGCSIRSGGPDALASLTATVREALSACAAGPALGADVERAVIGITGAGPARGEEVAAGVRAALAPLGIAGDRVEVLEDLRIAFLAGGAGGTGILLLAGTGAVAARFEEGRMVTRTDGMGWLLGDVGSAVWLGRHTLEAVAADIDGRGPRTTLTDRLGEILDLELRDDIDGPTGDARQDLIRATDALTPAQWGRFAALPGQALPDPVARGILDRATRALAQDVRRLDPGAELPVVLAGGVLAGGGPIRDELICGLEHAGHPEVRIARDGLAGAWELAMGDALAS